MESFFVGLRQELAIKYSKVSITIVVLGRIGKQTNRKKQVISFEYVEKFCFFFYQTLLAKEML